jgi:hypothetical protein
MAMTEPTPTEPVDLGDGVLEWPTDPGFVPVPIPEQDLTPQPEEG